MKRFRVGAVALATAAAAISVAPDAQAETYTVRGGETFSVGQPRAGLRSIAPGTYSVRLRDPNDMVTYGGQWSTCKVLLCGMGYEDNIDRTGIVLPNTAGSLMQVQQSDVAVYLFDVVVTRVE